MLTPFAPLSGVPLGIGVYLEGVPLAACPPVENTPPDYPLEYHLLSVEVVESCHIISDNLLGHLLGDALEMAVNKFSGMRPR